MMVLTKGWQTYLAMLCLPQADLARSAGLLHLLVWRSLLRVLCDHIQLNHHGRPGSIHPRYGHVSIQKIGKKSKVFSGKVHTYNMSWAQKIPAQMTGPVAICVILVIVLQQQ